MAEQEKRITEEEEKAVRFFVEEASKYISRYKAYGELRELLNADEYLKMASNLIDKGLCNETAP